MRISISSNTTQNIKKKSKKVKTHKNLLSHFNITVELNGLPEILY